jgi:hypothetical protein
LKEENWGSLSKYRNNEYFDGFFVSILDGYLLVGRVV